MFHFFRTSDGRLRYFTLIIFHLREFRKKFIISLPCYPTKMSEKHLQTDIIIDATYKKKPVKKDPRSNLPFPPWWDDECTKAKAARKAAEKTYNKNMTMENYLLYIKINKNTKKLLRHKKYDEWKRFCLSLNPNSPPLLVRQQIRRFKSGDPLPSYSGKLRLFAMRFCPYAERTVLVLNAKNLQYDLVFINLDHKPEWIFNFNPKGAVPALEYEPGKAIFDSNIINVYLDEKYPDVPLQATDPLRRAEDKIIVENFGAAQSAYYTAAFNPSGLKPDTAETFHKGLEYLQKEIEARGTKFLHGDQPGLVDYTLWPFLERFEALPLLGQADFAIDKSKYEILLTYMESMKNSPAVKAYYLAPDTHAKFTESRAKGDANYNMLDTSDVCCMRPRKKKQ